MSMATKNTTSNLKGNKTMTNTTTFQVGTTYLMGWIGDSEMFNRITILRRTAKSVWIKDIFTQDIVRKSVRIDEGVEQISPTGRYSMAPSLHANRTA